MWSYSFRFVETPRLSATISKVTTLTYTTYDHCDDEVYCVSWRNGWHPTKEESACTESLSEIPSCDRRNVRLWHGRQSQEYQSRRDFWNSKKCIIHLYGSRSIQGYVQEIGRYRGNEEEGLALSITTDSVWTKLYSMAWSNYVELTAVNRFIASQVNETPYSCVKYGECEQLFDCSVETMKTCLILLENEGFIEFECEFLNHLIITPMNHEQVSLFPLCVCLVDREKCILCLSLLVCRQLWCQFKWELATHSFIHRHIRSRFVHIRCVPTRIAHFHSQIYPTARDSARSCREILRVIRASQSFEVALQTLFHTESQTASKFRAFTPSSQRGST